MSKDRIEPVAVQGPIAFRRPFNNWIPACYVAKLIGLDTVSTFREPTSAASEDQGTTTCTVERDISTAAGVELTRFDGHRCPRMFLKNAAQGSPRPPVRRLLVIERQHQAQTWTAAAVPMLARSGPSDRSVPGEHP